METVSPASSASAPEAKDPASLFEDELILAAPATGSSGSGTAPANAPVVATTPRGSSAVVRPQKQTQSSNKSNEDRKRYHINTAK